MGRRSKEDRQGTGALGGMAGIGAALGVYSLYEPYRYRLVTHDLACHPGVLPLDVLHISDTHLGGNSRARIRWLVELPNRLGLTPDLVLATGDFVQDDSGIDPLAEVLAPLEARLGRYFVFGSHDYYQASFQSYAKYWTGKRNLKSPRADSARLRNSLQDKGWIQLHNRSEVIETPSGPVRLSGVDDPYLGRHKTDHLERGEHDRLAIGLMHSPEIVSEFTLAGFDLILAGHTHAGQVRLPFVGAVVTNCSLPAPLAGGPHRIGKSWLHVSPGLGTGKFSPIRFNCRPEATLLRLRPAG
ncbi:MAG TPA: metallophosphoesterase [Actinomycetota bacterium]|nr:metallophosphoesterase [Actinomycetota bacterium]